jgi:hypothetical protein
LAYRRLGLRGVRSGKQAIEHDVIHLGGIDEDLLKRLDEWRRKDDDPPSRPEAIRRPVGLGLKAKRKI